MESDLPRAQGPEMPASAVARQILDSMGKGDSRLARRIEPPRWFYVILAIISAVYVTGAAHSPGTIASVLLWHALPLWAVAGCFVYVAVTRQRGIRFAGSRGQGSRRLLGWMIAAIISGSVASLTIRFLPASPWWGLVPAFTAAVMVLTLGVRYNEALRAELADVTARDD